MSEQHPFSVDIGKLRTATKPEPTAQFVQTSDVAGERLGFVNRAPKGRGGRRPSPRTGQVHAKTLPHVAEEISAEAKRRKPQAEDVGDPELFIVFEAHYRSYRSAGCCDARYCGVGSS